MKDYRKSHLTSAKSRQYEEIIYAKFSYDDCVWQYEKEILDREVDALQKHGQPESYLDFACGSGRVLTHLENRFLNSIGVDNSEEMLKLAEKKIRRAQLLLADITKHDVLGDKSFDCITAFRFFLNAQPDLRKNVLDLLCRKLKTGGIFIFNIHGNTWSYRILTKFYLHHRGKRLNTLSYFEIKKMLEEAGFEVVRWYGFGVIPKIIYRILSPSFTFKIDRGFRKLPLTRWLSNDLIFACQKKHAYTDGESQAKLQ